MNSNQPFTRLFASLGRLLFAPGPTRKAPAIPPLDPFHRDVLDCVRALGRKLPPLGRRYSMQAFTIALAMHLRSTLKLGLREGLVTDEQARRLVGSILSDEGPQVANGDQGAARPQ